MVVDSTKLFHVSEEPDIALFKPRPVSNSDRRVNGFAVWAIDEEHLPGYLLPRDCPRVTYARGPRTTVSDDEHFFGISTARSIIAIEARWIEPAMNIPVYAYEMPAKAFEALDSHAGHYISRVAVEPLRVRKISNPLAEMLKHDVEVRIVKYLPSLHESVAKSTLSFSNTRLRNAAR